MSSAVALRPDSSQSQNLSLFDSAGGEPTLADVLAGAWEGLVARATAGCLICGGPMEPVYAARGDGQRAPAAGRCTRCGSSLS